MSGAAATISTVHDAHNASTFPALLLSGFLISVPFWQGVLEGVSDFAAAVAPILGCIVGLVTLYKSFGTKREGERKKLYERLGDTARDVATKPGARSGALLLVLGLVAIFTAMLPGKRAEASPVPMALLSSAPAAAKPRKRASDDAGEDGEADAVDDPAAPSWYRELLKLRGQHEGKKGKPNPIISAVFVDGGQAAWAKDTTAYAWCAIGISAALFRSGYPRLPSAMARSGLQYGDKLEKPRLGCIVVLWRGSPTSSSGHIGLYAGEDATHVYLLGCNQSDSVTVARFAKSKVLGYRWPRKPSQLRTVKAAVTSAASSAGALVSTGVIVAESIAPVQKPLQDIGTPATISLAAKIAMACAVIALIAAVVAAVRRVRDHKERGV